MPTVRIYLHRALMGWRYSCEAGQLRADGWRPTRSWARNAAQHRCRRLASQLERLDSAR